MLATVAITSWGLSGGAKTGVVVGQENIEADVRIEPTAQQKAGEPRDRLVSTSFGNLAALKASRQAERFSAAFLRLRDLRVGAVTTPSRMSGMSAIGVMSKQNCCRPHKPRR